MASLIALGVACSATSNDGAGGAGSGAGGGAGSGGAGAESGSGGVGVGATAGASGSTATGGVGASDGGTTTEDCTNGQDDDANNMVDEGCPCTDGTTQGCWSGPAERRNKGQCKDGQQACQPYGEFFSWGPCVGEILPSSEVPGNGVDEDCDGEDPGGCVPTSTYEECSNGWDDDCNALADCDDPACAGFCNCGPAELCGDGIDNDCNSQIDCQDAACVGATECKPVSGCTPQFPFFLEIMCGDNFDNDCDSKVDCDDPDCKKPGSCGCAPTETSCSNGVDDDCDKSVDCADRDCQKCKPGSIRWCDDPQYCHWGKQTCGPDSKWGDCIETSTPPGGCGGTLYSAECCVQAGQCCQNYPKDDASIGNCDGIVQCG